MVFTRKGSKAYSAHLKDVLSCICLDTDPKMKNTKNNKEIKVIMEYNYIPRPNFCK